MSDSIELPNGRAAVATLISTQGTTPKDAGAKMWVGEDGSILGSVTIGGCVDARVIEESARVLSEGTSALLSMSLGDEDAWALGMTCGGTIEVLIEPVDPTKSGDEIARSLRLARDEVAVGRRVVIVAPLDGRNERERPWIGSRRESRAAPMSSWERRHSACISSCTRRR
jgi:xanthine dehydrogenase accessory factor